MPRGCLQFVILAVPRGCLQFVIVVFPDHTHFLFLFANSVEPDQTPRFVSTDLVLQSLLMSLKKGARLIISYFAYLFFRFDPEENLTPEERKELLAIQAIGDGQRYSGK